MRQAATRHAQAWYVLTSDPLFCDLLSLLYAPNSAASFTLGWGSEHITRDGPLTELVAPALAANDPLHALRTACRQAWERASPQRAWAGVVLLLLGEQLEDVEQWKHLLQEPIKHVFELASMAIQRAEEYLIQILFPHLEDKSYVACRFCRRRRRGGG